MVPQVARVAHPLGVSVYSTGGFESDTVQAEALLDSDALAATLAREAEERARLHSWLESARDPEDDG